MTLNELFTCPNCKANKTALRGSHVMLGDVRVDNLLCMECNTEWRGYSKVTDVEIEVVHAPQPEPAPVEPAVVEETVVTEVVESEVQDEQ